MKDDTHQAHSFIQQRNYDYGGQMILGELLGLKFPDIYLTGEEKPRKNLLQETCPDRGSNPGPLFDRRACYRPFHNGGLRTEQLHILIQKMVSSIFTATLKHTSEHDVY